MPLIRCANKGFRTLRSGSKYIQGCARKYGCAVDKVFYALMGGLDGGASKGRGVGESGHGG